MVRILIDRDLTLQFGGPAGIVARFEESFPLSRVIDGTELAIVFEMGRFEGGMFATQYERRWGASWAWQDPELLDWGKHWAERGRLGEDLFLVDADGEGHVFFHQAGRQQIDFDPEGPPEQPAEMPAELCSTGLGCSVVVSVDDVDIFEPTTEGPWTTRLMSKEDIEAYIEEHPLPDVVLRNMGFGTEFYAGMILGVSVIVGQDHDDGLWSVQDRDDRRFVVGAWSKDAAVNAAVDLIDDGEHTSKVEWLNDPPKGFEHVQVGDEFRAMQGMSRGFVGKVVEIGASYVMLRGRRPRGDYDETRQVDAKDLMNPRRWKEV